MSRTVPVNSDGAANALQAWDMLHGNLLLHTWRLSDVSFYTTELPQYMLIELVRGLTPDVVHVAAAMTYTFVVLLAARLAKGDAAGTQGLLRAGIAAGLMVAPQHSEVTVLMLSPDHVGSTVPVLATWLLIDRAKRRWYVPPVACVLLGGALVADQIVLVTGIAPLVIVGVAAAYQRVIGARAPLRRGWYGLALAAAGAAAAEAGWRALALIRAHGGFYVFPAPDRIAGLAHLPGNLLQTYQGTLLLFGADFLGQRPGLALALAFTHLAGLALAVWGLCAAIRRLATADLAVRLLTAGTLISLAAFAFGPNAYEALSSREFAAVLPFGAALAGRLLAARLRHARLVPALVAVLAVYAAGVVKVASMPPVPAQNQAIADWLAAHKLTYGLAGYWIANSITLDSGGAVRMAPIKGAEHRLAVCLGRRPWLVQSGQARSEFRRPARGRSRSWPWSGRQSADAGQRDRDIRTARSGLFPGRLHGAGVAGEPAGGDAAQVTGPPSVRPGPVAAMTRSGHSMPVGSTRLLLS